MAGSRTHRVPKLMVNTTDVEAKWAAQDAATALVQTNLDDHEAVTLVHVPLDDSGVTNGVLWSAGKIISELASKADSPLVIGDFPDDTITPAKLDIDNAEVDTYVLSYDLASTSFKWVERVKVDGTNLAADAITEAMLNIFTAPGAGVDNFAICYDHGNTRLDYMEMMLPDISNLSVEIPEAVLEVVGHATALEDGYALAWNNGAGKMEWTDMSAIVGADTYKAKWDGADVAEYLGLKLPKPTTGSGYEVYRVNGDASAIELGPAVSATNRVYNAECVISSMYGSAVVSLSAGLLAPAGPGITVDGVRPFLVNVDELILRCEHTGAISGYSSNSVMFTVQAGETAIAADELVVPYRHKFAGYSLRDLAGSTADAVVSFVFISSAPNNSVFSVSLLATDGTSYVTDFTYLVSGAAQVVTKVIPLDSKISGATAGLALTLVIGACGGADYQAAATDSWQAGAKYYSGSQLQWALTAPYYLRFGAIQFVPGNVYTPLQHKAFSEYLAECQMYLSKSYSFAGANAPVGTATAEGQRTWKNQSAAAAIDVYKDCSFPVDMIAVPTVVMYSPTTGASGNIRNTTAGADVAATAGDIGTRGFGYIDTGAVTIGTLHVVNYHYLAYVTL